MVKTRPLLLHEKTDHELRRYLLDPFHFLLIVGPTGSGKLSTAQLVAASLLNIESDKLADFPHFIHLKKADGKQQISIDDIRYAISRLNLKTIGKKVTRRIVLIEDAQHLSEEAQNALLKTLEEPPADTVLILTVDATASLLATIVSRAHILRNASVPLQASLNYFTPKHPKTAVETAWLLSDGSAGLLNALLDEPIEHRLKAAVEDAKTFIKQTAYERLLKTDSFAKNKLDLINLLEGLSKVLRAAQTISLTSGKLSGQAKITAARKLISELSRSTQANVSPKLIYLRLSLNLKL